jgi:hypothetical protein
MMIRRSSGMRKTVLADQLAPHVGMPVNSVDDVRLALERITALWISRRLTSSSRSLDARQRSLEKIHNLVGVGRVVLPL